MFSEGFLELFSDKDYEELDLIVYDLSCGSPLEPLNVPISSSNSTLGKL